MQTVTHAVLAASLVASHCLLSGCATATSDKSQGMTEQTDNPVKEAIGDVEVDYKKADTRHEDIIDRAFAPLDNSVSDINHDLND